MAKKTYSGRLIQGEFSQRVNELELTIHGNEFPREAVGRLPMTKELRTTILNPLSGLMYKFVGDDGTSFDLVIAGKVSLDASSVRVSSSGRVPGLM